MKKISLVCFLVIIFITYIFPSYRHVTGFRCNHCPPKTTRFNMTSLQHKSLIAALLLLSLSSVDALSMQQSRSSSRLFLNTPPGRQKQNKPRQPRLATRSYPLKSSIPADTPLVTPPQSPKIVAALRGLTPAELSRKAEVRRRRKLYKELRVANNASPVVVAKTEAAAPATSKQAGLSKMSCNPRQPNVQFMLIVFFLLVNGR